MSLQVQLHRLPSSSCHLHPDELVTGFYASCLHERLVDLDSPAFARKFASSSAFKSLFFKAVGGVQPTSSNSTSSSFSRPELCRCKSYSYGRGNGFSEPHASAAFELQHKSCNVCIRNTLWSLFHQDNSERDKNQVRDPFLPSASASATAGGEVEGKCRNLRFPPPSSSVVAPVLKTWEEEEEVRDDVDEIRVVDPILIIGTSGEIDGGERKEAELRPMKDHMGFDSATQTKKPPPKDLKDIAGSFWLAASVFSKKLQKWQRKQKFKKQQGGRILYAVVGKFPQVISAILRHVLRDRHRCIRPVVLRHRPTVLPRRRPDLLRRPLVLVGQAQGLLGWLPYRRPIRVPSPPSHALCRPGRRCPSRTALGRPDPH